MDHILLTSLVTIYGATAGRLWTTILAVPTSRPVISIVINGGMTEIQYFGWGVSKGEATLKDLCVDGGVALIKNIKKCNGLPDFVLIWRSVIANRGLL